MEKKMNDKQKIGLGVLALIIAFGCGYFAKPTKVETVTKTVEVIKQDTSVKQNEKKNKKVTIDKHVNKDGSSDTKTVITDNGSTETNTNTKTEIKKEDSSSTIVKNDIGLTISALAIVNSNDFTGKREYGVHITKRILGNVTIGAMATTDKKVGISVGMGF
jgi:archaellum component FlaF (FlaF/FlaG flagellin family)